MATIGSVSNPDYHLVRYGKAKPHAPSRHPSDGARQGHEPGRPPHGGGEGKHPIGMKYPKTKWGTPLGVKTRRKNRPSEKLILQRRKNASS